jgi:hypothetical protein
MAAQTNPNFEADLARWLAGAQAKINKYYQDKFPNLETPTLSLERGRRYIRVVRGEGRSGTDGRSVFAFIDANGDVLKPEGWAKPALHARGNIGDPNHGLARVGPYGPEYLR